VRHKRVRSALVVTEIALALMLLVGSGLLIRTSLALRAVKPGFDTHNVLTMRMSVSGTPFERRDGIARLTREGLHQILTSSEVTAASTTCCMPLETVWQLDFVVQGRPLKGAFHAFAGWTFVSPGYFDVFRIPIVRGRDFTERDDAGAPGVVIINQEMARRFWPNGDPLNDSLIIGRSVRPDYDADPVRQIVGIVGDVRDQGLSRTPRPAMYVPVAQVPDGVTILNVRLLPIVWIARTKNEPHAVGPRIRKALQEVSGGLPVARIRSMDEVVSEATARTRFDTVLMSVFAASALVLAAIGVYGLMAYSVEQRTQEIGIRLALGAEPEQVRRMILRHGMTLAVLGIAIGTTVSFGLARVLAGMLFGVSPRDPAIFVSVPLLLGAVALFAAWLPAIRAARMTPMNALRYE
jgi:putative ABC transport system permease protein